MMKSVMLLALATVACAEDSAGGAMGLVCPTSPPQRCKMLCPPISCPAGTCAMRQGSCCSVRCVAATGGVGNGAASSCLRDDDCPSASFCRPTTSNYNGPKACVARRRQGQSCGGFTPPQYQNRCMKGLQCVQQNPMMADGPGKCSAPCRLTRDRWGNCVKAQCKTWFDGCNTCAVAGTRLTACTKKQCYRRGQAACKDNHGGKSAAGQMCGGFAGLRCPTGYECETKTDCVGCADMGGHCQPVGGH